MLTSVPSILPDCQTWVEAENARLKRLPAEKELEIQTLTEIFRKTGASLSSLAQRFSTPRTLPLPCLS